MKGNVRSGAVCRLWKPAGSGADDRRAEVFFVNRRLVQAVWGKMENILDFSEIYSQKRTREWN